MLSNIRSFTFALITQTEKLTTDSQPILTDSRPEQALLGAVPANAGANATVHCKNCASALCAGLPTPHNPDRRSPGIGIIAW